ncbi:hypothetical protein WJX75_007132 [Coccomyxa subellipsoidea]|uniref:Uncharacterized protein n=1 Tax=Coccomyxa subellipsoidea TaxID=248742 RepID=A0ABR2YIL3_9CHLO
MMRNGCESHLTCLVSPGVWTLLTLALTTSLCFVLDRLIGIGYLALDAQSSDTKAAVWSMLHTSSGAVDHISRKLLSEITGFPKSL